MFRVAEIQPQQSSSIHSTDKTATGGQKIYNKMERDNYTTKTRTNRNRNADYVNRNINRNKSCDFCGSTTMDIQLLKFLQ